MARSAKRGQLVASPHINNGVTTAQLARAGIATMIVVEVDGFSIAPAKIGD
jgi:hypothetical protein